MSTKIEVTLLTMPNQERMNNLRGLSPIDSVRAWLNGEFGIDEESALIEALRKDPRITQSDVQIIDTFCDAFDQGLNEQQTFERLIVAH